MHHRYPESVSITSIILYVWGFALAGCTAIDYVALFVLAGCTAIDYVACIVLTGCNVDACGQLAENELLVQVAKQ